jgi:hypothetical protein
MVCVDGLMKEVLKCCWLMGCQSRYCVDEEERSEEVGGAIICTDVALASDCKLAFGTCARISA